MFFYITLIVAQDTPAPNSPSITEATTIAGPTAIPVLVWTGRELAPVIIEGGRIGVIRVWVRGRVGLPVKIASEGGWDTVGVVGTKQEYGLDAFEVSPLPPGQYTITPEGLGLTFTVDIVAGEIAQVLFEQVEAQGSVVFP